MRAGLLTDEDDAAPSVREAIGRDPLLTAEQKQALLNVYESYVGAEPGRVERRILVSSVALAVKRVAMISLHTSPLLQPGPATAAG